MPSPPSTPRPASGPKPDVTVAVVADYAAGEPSAFATLHATLAALAAQTFEGRVEILLGESRAVRLEAPEALRRVLPGLEIVTTEGTSSYELKNACVAAASADLVAILDADCVPAPDWLARLVAAMRAHPGAAAISGRTAYAGRSLTERGLGLLTRSYTDRGVAGPTRFVSNNNAIWRRDVFLAHPLPVGLGAFAARLQSEAARRAGHAFRSEPAARATHAFEGWRMERDIRRQIGYATVATRLHDARMPHASLVRLGPASIPLIVAGKTVDAWRDCLRCASGYDVRVHELPLVLGAAVVVQAMEAPGMWRAFRGASRGATAYR